MSDPASANDIVAAILAAVAARVSVGDDVARAVELEVGSAFGGERYYVSNGAAERRDSLANALGSAIARGTAATIRVRELRR